MSDNNMSGNDALRVAIEWLDYGCHREGSDLARQAMDVLSRGTKKTEYETRDKRMRKCNNCGAVNSWDKTLCVGCGVNIADNHHLVRCNCKFTVHDEIKVLPVMSELEFEEVK